MSIHLSIVMPAYNEEDCIEQVVSKWLAMLNEYFFETDVRMIVINDGSTDRTGEILDNIAVKQPQLIVVHQPNEGHGKSIYNGYLKAIEIGPEWIFQVDSDDQFLPNDFLKLWSKRSESLFILGQRMNRNDPFHRIVISKIVQCLLAFLFSSSIKDSNIPFRLINGKYLEILLKQFKEIPFAPNIFISILAKRDGQNLINIPITHLERVSGKVSIVKWGLIKVCIKSFKELLFFSLKLKKHLRQIEQLKTLQGGINL